MCVFMQRATMLVSFIRLGEDKSQATYLEQLWIATTTTLNRPIDMSENQRGNN